VTELLLTYWSTVFIPANVPLGKVNRSNLRLFAQKVGATEPHGHLLSLADTNMRDAGRVDIEIAVKSVAWRIMPAVPAGDLEALAQAHHDFDDPQDVATLQNHGVLAWDFAQTSIYIGPLWLDRVEQNIRLPIHATFAVSLTFGESSPPIRREHALRVGISGAVRSMSL
jgi:hypothetical protein